MESPLKPEYDDAILVGAIEDSYLTRRYENIKRRDGCAARDFLIRQQANDLAIQKGGDGVVAQGIATAILNSIVIYGGVGRDFLKQKLEQEGETFSQMQYLKDVAVAMVSGYRYDRKQKIVDGVIAALNDDSENVEANAAKTAIMENEYWLEHRYDEGKVLEGRFLNGSVIKMEQIYRRLEYMHHKSLPDKECLQNLELAYNHLQQNYDRIPDKYKAEYPNLSQGKIIAYFIANLHDTEMQEVLDNARKNPSSEDWGNR